MALSLPKGWGEGRKGVAMAPYYPVFLDLKGRHCVVIGGGEVAERKVQGLLECHARVTVVSPSAAPNIRERAGTGELQWQAREYAEGDLKGAFLAIAATDRREVNEAVACEAAREGVILNVVDNPALCTFIAPSVVRRGEVTLALSTGGASPALARKIRESLERSEALEFSYLAEILSFVRKELRRRGVEVQPDRWQESITEELVALVKAGKSQQALDQLINNLLEISQEEAKALS